MRTAALGLVTALSGCNQIWGNDPVMRWDAPAGEGNPEAPLPTARVELLVASTDATGAATNVPELRAIEPPPTVQIGRVDGALAQVSYEGGAIRIPHDFPGSPWRLVFTRTGDLPREVHWAPAAGVEGRAVVPQFGGVDRGPVPAGASYRLAPTGAPGQYTDLRAYSTGVWAVGMPTAAGSVATQQVNEIAFKPVAGPLLAPDPTKGDLVVLANYAGTTPCQKAIGAAVFRIPLTGPDSQPAAAPAYVTTGTGVQITGFDIAVAGRYADRYGTAPISHAMYGIGASTVAPAFVTTPFGSPLRGPAMMPLIRCISLSAPSGTLLVGSEAFAVPVLDTSLPRVAHLQLLTERAFPNGARASEGLSASQATESDSVTSFAFDWVVGIPTNIKLGDAVLTGTTDRVPITGSGSTVDLTFVLDDKSTNVPGLADYATATLYRLTTSATLVPEREYTFVGTTLTLDRAVLAAQTEYVIEVRTYTGAPGALAGNYTQYLETQYSASRFTRTFVTP